MRSCLLVFILLSFVLWGCKPNDEQSKTLTIFAAASLTDLFTELGHNFEAQHKDVRVRFNFASSSQLATQINNGLRGDIFASANESQMEFIAKKGHIEAPPIIFAQNSIVLIVSKHSSIEISDISDLEKDGIRFITAIEGVPIREYTNKLLANLSQSDVYGENFARQVFNNLVSEEINVRQLVIKVALGEADAAFVYASDITPEIQDSLTVITIPTEHNIIARYTIAVLDSSSQKALAQEFIAFILSADATLEKWGFLPVE
ncbi:MAG: molybdate ABC transporter substrate-binding protein [Phototrophicales bacterium]|nr:MAG: molybdate ABC transporter substrate-binding protein [Phototrophicales bacterium]